MSRMIILALFPLLSMLVIAARVEGFLGPATTTIRHSSAGSLCSNLKKPRINAIVSKNNDNNNIWNDNEHIAHNAAEIHEETDEELQESEMAAAWDAHDSPDAGMEAAAEERAVMLAKELIHDKLHPQNKDKNKKNEWNDQHVAHDLSDIHLETPEELHDSEDAAAWDAHDSPDAGMEAAAEERAVMLANELMQQMIEKKKKASTDKQ